MRHSVKNLTLIALFAVIIAICSWVTIPFYVVPFTLQTLGVFLTLRFLGSKRGTVAIAVYLVLGALGVPVFAGFTGGIGRLLGPTGGYLVGFLVSGLVMMLLDRWKTGKYVWTLLKMAIAMAACYLVGTVWFAFQYTSMSIGAVLMACVVPFLIPDAVKILVAERVGTLLKKKIPTDA